ncbi:hypothetical protein B296_00017921, partial [Ensete ventricosum]
VVASLQQGLLKEGAAHGQAVEAAARRGDACGHDTRWQAACKGGRSQERPQGRRPWRCHPPLGREAVSGQGQQPPVQG